MCDIPLHNACSLIIRVWPCMFALLMLFSDICCREYLDIIDLTTGEFTSSDDDGPEMFFPPSPTVQVSAPAENQDE